MSKEKEKAVISSYIPFHGPFSPRVKFECSCLGRCFHSLIMKTPNVPQRAQEQAKAGGGRECPGTLCSLICKQVFSFKLGLLCNFSKDILEQPSVTKQGSDHSGPGCKTLRATHRHVLFVSLATESAILEQLFFSLLCI